MACAAHRQAFDHCPSPAGDLTQAVVGILWMLVGGWTPLTSGLILGRYYNLSEECRDVEENSDHCGVTLIFII